VLFVLVVIYFRYYRMLDRDVILVLLEKSRIDR